MRGALLGYVAYLSRREERAPLVHQLGEHAIWPTFLNLAQSAEHRKLIVSHAHVSLVRLNISFGNRLELGGGNRRKEAKAIQGEQK